MERKEVFEGSIKDMTNNAKSIVSAKADYLQWIGELHLEELGLPMGITDYELKKVLPTQAQLAKCYADAEAQFAVSSSRKEKGKLVE